MPISIEELQKILDDTVNKVQDLGTATNMEIEERDAIIDDQLEQLKQQNEAADILLEAQRKMLNNRKCCIVIDPRQIRRIIYITVGIFLIIFIIFRAMNK